MDIPTTAAAWIVPALGILGSLAYAFRQKANSAALLAERDLENEKQESAAQAHLLGRLTAMDTRIAQLQQQLDAERAEARRVHWALEDTNRLQAAQIRDLEATVAQLAADKARLAARVVELEQELRATVKRAEDLKREYESSVALTKPTTLTERPPPARGCRKQ